MDRQPRSMLITDCGTSITSAVLIELIDDTYQMTARSEAVTTVTPPLRDVTIGVAKAVRGIEESRGRKLLAADNQGIITPQQNETDGVDLYLSTSSTGGGLQMMVAGLVRIMTAESAERAALGAGAMVIDVIAIDDGRPPHAKIQRIRELNPDMILLSGGIDGGNYEYVLELAEHIESAKLSTELPVIYAGNIAARDNVSKILKGKARLFFVDNVRPVLEKEVLEPAGKEIHSRFMEHVVAKAPGYKELANWASKPILPTTGAIGSVMEGVATSLQQNIVGINVGDATTDVFSVFSGRFTRTVSGDLGMGSSISNALVQAGIKNVSRWLPFDIPETDLRNIVRNKSLRQGTIPITQQDLMLDHAITREIVRLGLIQHRGSVVGLRGVQRQRDVSDIFDQVGSGESLFDSLNLHLIIAMGVPFQQAPRPMQTMLMLIDSVQPQGITQVAMDKHFTAPHLGMLSTVNKDIALEVFERDALVTLGTVVTPVGRGKIGESCVRVTLELANGDTVTESCDYGSIKLVDLPPGNYNATISPTSNFDVGEGRGKTLKARLSGGPCGVVLDGRQGLISTTDDLKSNRRESLLEWYQAVDAYPLAKGVWK